MSSTKREFDSFEANPIILYGKQSASESTAYPVLTDVSGNLSTSLATTIAGEDVSADIQRVSVSGSSSSYISTATTTLVLTGRGVIVGLCLTETAAGTITVYDNITATGTILGVLKASIVEGNYLQGVPFSTGCTIVTAGASKLTAIVSR